MKKCPLTADLLHQGNGKENEAKDRNAAREAPAAEAAELVKGRDTADENTPWNKWARHCHSTLGSTAAAAVLKVTS